MRLSGLRLRRLRAERLRVELAEAERAEVAASQVATLEELVALTESETDNRGALREPHRVGAAAFSGGADRLVEHEEQAGGARRRSSRARHEEFDHEPTITPAAPSAARPEPPALSPLDLLPGAPKSSTARELPGAGPAGGPRSSGAAPEPDPASEPEALTKPTADPKPDTVVDPVTLTGDLVPRPESGLVRYDADSHTPYGRGSLAPRIDGAPPRGYPIKGNIDTMLFHTEASRWFSRIKADVWFESEEVARMAGFTRWDQRGTAAHTFRD